jgi:hypothetical protein
MLKKNLCVRWLCIFGRHRCAGSGIHARPAPNKRNLRFSRRSPQRQKGEGWAYGVQGVPSRAHPAPLAAEHLQTSITVKKKIIAGFLAEEEL